MLVFVSVSLLSFRSGSAPGHLVSLLNFEEAMTQIRNVEEPWYPTQRGGGGVGLGAPRRRRWCGRPTSTMALHLGIPPKISRGTGTCYDAGIVAVALDVRSGDLCNSAGHRRPSC
jgi:hypothetical protein